MDNLSLRPIKFNLKKKTSPKTNISNYNDIKKRIHFQITNLNDSLGEIKTLLLEVISSINNKDVYITIQKEIDKHKDMNMLLNFIYKKYKYSLNYKIKTDLENYLYKNKEDVIENNKLNTDSEDDMECIDYNLNKINSHIDFSKLGDMSKLNLNKQNEYDNEENIFSDEN